MHAAANMHQHAHAKCNLSHGQVKPSASIQQKGNATTQSGTQIQTVYLHAYSCQMQIGYLHVYMLSMPDQLSKPADAKSANEDRVEAYRQWLGLGGHLSRFEECWRSDIFKRLDLHRHNVLNNSRNRQLT